MYSHSILYLPYWSIFDLSCKPSNTAQCNTKHLVFILAEISGNFQGGGPDFSSLQK